MEKIRFHVLHAVKRNRTEDIIFVNCSHNKYSQLSKLEDVEGEEERHGGRG